MTVKIIAELLAEAVETCVTCDGNGWRKPPGNIHPVGCPDCRGNGNMLSDSGHELVEFMTRWLQPKFSERDHGHSLH